MGCAPGLDRLDDPLLGPRVDPGEEVPLLPTEVNVGQALAPVHELFVAAAADDVEGASRAAQDIVTLGETSGADLLLGLEWGIDAACQRFGPFSAQRRR